MEKPHVKRWNDIARSFLGEDFFAGFANTSGEEKGGPPADVYHNDQEAIVLVELPGIENIQTLEIRVQEGKLKIKGTLPNPYPGYELKSSERQNGDFEKIIPMGANVSSKYTTAKYRRGILELRFPIVEQSTTKKIKVKNNR